MTHASLNAIYDYDCSYYQHQDKTYHLHNWRHNTIFNVTCVSLNSEELKHSTARKGTEIKTRKKYFVSSSVFIYHRNSTSIDSLCLIVSVANEIMKWNGSRMCGKLYGRFPEFCRLFFRTGEVKSAMGLAYGWKLERLIVTSACRGRTRNVLFKADVQRARDDEVKNFGV